MKLYKLLASWPNKDLDIRNMIAKAFYTTPNKVSYDLHSQEVINSGERLEGWKLIIKGNRVRLEFLSEGSR